ncbi:MAG: hypothetical protein JWO18_1074 [Microbacteriaceae bacterium]|nr:hypothetical protein [Microbacteriaceae bacterium]
MSQQSGDADWPLHRSERRAWHQRQRGGTKADRTLTEIVVSIPPRIAELDFAARADQTKSIDEATAAVVRSDALSADQAGALGGFLIQNESVASSKIERIEARTEDFARALAGAKSNESAVSMVNATKALTEMVESVGASGRIELDQILQAHWLLMKDDPQDGPFAGKIREVQNWILGSDWSPRDAVHIPPPPELVPALLEDLVHYANRDDVPVVVQAAAVHAQFESIHPFTDGNGRIGRGLINAVLRRRGTTTVTVVPVASALLAERQRYFDLVNNYRLGYLGAFVDDLAHAALIAAEESKASADRLRTMPADWAARSKWRANSAGAALLAALPANPVLTSEIAEELAGSNPASTYAALDRLDRDGVIHEITGRQKNKVWVASDVMDELDDLSKRIGDRVLADRSTT